jgi:FKBP-type peptidyl-prolyl cis-trans isomerase
MFAVVALVFASCGNKGEEDEKVDLKTFKDKLSYVLGAEQARMITESGDPNLEKLNFDEMLLGFDKGMNNEKAMDAGCQEALGKLYGPYGQDFDTTYVKSGSNCIGKIAGSVFYQTWTKKGVMNQIDAKIARIGFKHGLQKKDTLVDRTLSMKMVTEFITGINKKSGDKLMAGARKMPNTKSITGGIVVETLLEGTGGSPSATDDVKVNYILISAEGDTIESSYKIMEQSGKPNPAFNLTGVIQGWSMAFPTLKKGGKYHLYIPWELAYGEQNQCESLKFFVELIDFGPKGTLAKAPEMEMPPQ